MYAFIYACMHVCCNAGICTYIRIPTHMHAHTHICMTSDVVRMQSARNELDEKFYIKFAQFEQRQKEMERAQDRAYLQCPSQEFGKSRRRPQNFLALLLLQCDRSHLRILATWTLDMLFAIRSDVMPTDGVAVFLGSKHLGRQSLGTDITSIPAVLHSVCIGRLRKPT